MFDWSALFKGLVEFAAFLLLAQGGIYLLSFGGHERNAVYRAVRFLTSPITRLVRRITPSRITDRHVPVVAFFLLFWIWVLVFNGIRLMPRIPGA
ncbi:MAG: hypothetical protein KA164_20300 [Rhodoferax sp.]|mgnify:CR=1 FL=1|jgi:hypothetical protein|nr:hypothetical protein [Rhodoferax sp.]